MVFFSFFGHILGYRAHCRKDYDSFHQLGFITHLTSNDLLIEKWKNVVK
jgi:hypothetical protein